MNWTIARRMSRKRLVANRHFVRMAIGLGRDPQAGTQNIGVNRASMTINSRVKRTKCNAQIRVPDPRYSPRLATDSCANAIAASFTSSSTTPLETGDASVSGVGNEGSTEEDEERFCAGVGDPLLLFDSFVSELF